MLLSTWRSRNYLISAPLFPLFFRILLWKLKNICYRKLKKEIDIVIFLLFRYEQVGTVLRVNIVVSGVQQVQSLDQVPAARVTLFRREQLEIGMPNRILEISTAIFFLLL